jgi:hypothetical protein
VVYRSFAKTFFGDFLQSKKYQKKAFPLSLLAFATNITWVIKINFLLYEPRPFSISEQEIIIPKKKCTDVTSVPSHSLVYPGLTVI